MKGIGWFSGGVTSAVAIKKALEQGHQMDIIYFETGSHHPDHKRFISDCEKWYGQKIVIMQNQKYSDHFDVVKKTRFVNGPTGAQCTKVLKKEIRQKIETIMGYDFQVFGFEFESKQIKRAERFSLEYENAKPIYPLIEELMDKKACMELLLSVGIELPEMYKLGYSNSNCIGCVKGGMGYWNKIRRDFPDYFDRMAKLEREIKATCLRRDKKKIYLDELDPEAGRHEDITLPECGVVCPVEMGA
jgi:3'-phosphoadenosine 5'-phosphosulfate sulfotransferase (PAPS reductase)/FAD synthetase